MIVNFKILKTGSQMNFLELASLVNETWSLKLSDENIRSFPIGIIVRVFLNGSESRDPNPMSSHTKDSKNGT